MNEVLKVRTSSQFKEDLKTLCHEKGINLSDFIRVSIRDNLNSINRIRFLSVGALDV